MNPDPAGQAHMNMQLAVAIGKGVQLDAEQTATVLARIESQSAGLERLQADLDAWLEASKAHDMLFDAIYEARRDATKKPVGDA